MVIDFFFNSNYPSLVDSLEGNGIEMMDSVVPGAGKGAEESYDNLNETSAIEASYVIEDEDYDNAVPKQVADDQKWVLGLFLE